MINAHVPEEYGGLGLGCTEGCMINEEVAYGCSGIGTALEANSLGVRSEKYILITLKLKYKAYFSVSHIYDVRSPSLNY